MTKTGLGSPKWVRPAVRGSALVLAFVLGGVVGCKKQPRAAPAAPASVLLTAAPASSAPRPKSTASVDPQARKRALDEARARLVTYQKALREGRGLTKAGKYAAAAKAFSAALEAQPDDPRAYAERGYAELLAKDYESAQGDLEKAAAGGGDRSLRAQTFFNLGLVREALNQDPTSAFALSSFLHPSSAAQKKLEGKSTCPIEVKRVPDIPQETRYRDWLAFLAGARDSFNVDGLDLGSNAAAKNTMCYGDACAKATGPWIALGLDEVFFVRPLAAGLAVTSVAQSNRAAYCDPDNDAEVLETTKDALVIRARDSMMSQVLICWDDSHAEHDCSAEEEQEIEQDPSSELKWVRGCHVERFTKYEVFDRVKEMWTLRLTQFADLIAGLEDAEKIQVHTEPGRIVVSGPGCNEVFSLPSGQ